MPQIVMTGKLVFTKHSEREMAKQIYSTVSTLVLIAYKNTINVHELLWLERSLFFAVLIMLLILYTKVSEVFSSFVNKKPNGIGTMISQ